MDQKARKILMQTYWQSGGWRSGGYTYTEEDFQYAKSKGLMFDRLTISHDECVQRLRQLHEKFLTKELVVKAFCIAYRRAKYIYAVPYRAGLLRIIYQCIRMMNNLWHWSPIVAVATVMSGKSCPMLRMSMKI